MPDDGTVVIERAAIDFEKGRKWWSFQLLERTAPPPVKDAAQVRNRIDAFLQAAREQGISVPDELALIGYDDLPWSAFVDPPLTAIRQPIDEMAQRATRLLLRRIDQRLERDVSPTSLHRQYVIGVELVDRRSCGSSERHLMSSR